MASTSTPGLLANYFDGTHTLAHPVTLQLKDGVLSISGKGITRALACCDVQWPERTRHGLRVAHFKEGGSVQCADTDAWDAWIRSSGQRESLVVKMQQSWRGVLASVLVLIVVVVILGNWGLPVASRALVTMMPLSVDRALGESSLALIDQHLMRPSQLPAAEQTRLRAAWAQALSTLPAGTVPAWQLVFRKSRIGPNALALPDGTLIMTDELVELVGRDEKVITAVLAHELGHVQHRDTLRMLVQAGLLSGLAGLVLGDFDSLMASVPVLLGQASYSREAEHEADVEAVRILKVAGISPGVMVTLFEKMAEKKNKANKAADPQEEKESWLGIAFSSHPADADRVMYFKQASAGH